jgi:hypothetical protein
LVPGRAEIVQISIGSENFKIKEIKTNPKLSPQ